MQLRELGETGLRGVTLGQEALRGVKCMAEDMLYTITINIGNDMVLPTGVLPCV